MDEARSGLTCNDCSGGVKGAGQAVDETGMLTSNPSSKGAVSGATMRLAGEKRRSERVPHVMDAWICSPTANNPLPLTQRETVTVETAGPSLTFLLLRAGRLWL